jgi:hypothetical protein
MSRFTEFTNEELWLLGKGNGVMHHYLPQAAHAGNTHYPWSMMLLNEKLLREICQELIDRQAHLDLVTQLAQETGHRMEVVLKEIKKEETSNEN